MDCNITRLQRSNQSSCLTTWAVGPGYYISRLWRFRSITLECADLSALSSSATCRSRPCLERSLGLAASSRRRTKAATGSPHSKRAQASDDARHDFDFGRGHRPIARLPFEIMKAGPPLFFGLTDLFVLACVLYDLITLKRIHRTTALAGLFIVASQPLHLLLGGTHAWLAFAAWLTDWVA